MCGTCIIFHLSLIFHSHLHCFHPCLLVMACKCAAIDCNASSWSAWAPFAGGGNVLRRHRSVVQAAENGGASCPQLEQTEGFNEVMCSPHVKYGLWSNCTALCGGGWRYRWAEHVVCSATAAVKQGLLFREAGRCSLQHCEEGEAPDDHPVIVPELD